MDGKLNKHSLIQDLYWQKPEITITDKGKRLPDLPVDARILVRHRSSDEWQKRHFSHFNDGVVYCWARGLTSFTEIDAFPWSQWKLHEDEE